MFVRQELYLSQTGILPSCKEEHLEISAVELEIKSSKLTLRRLMSYIYGVPILDVSRSHTTTQHSR